MTKVKDVMHPAFTVDAGDPVSLAVQMMLWTTARHLPVTGDGRLVGIVTERDILRHRAEAGDEALSAPVESVMSAPPQYVAPEASLGEVAERMAARKVGCLPVVDQGSVVGIVTAIDVLARQARSLFSHRTIESLTVGEIMTRDPVTVGDGDPLLEAAERMARSGARHLPVVDAEGRLAGILSDRDLRTVLGGPLSETDEGRAETRLARVWSVMTRTPMSTTKDAPIARVLPWLVDARLGALPVVAEGGRLEGIVSYVDVLRALQA